MSMRCNECMATTTTTIRFQFRNPALFPWHINSVSLTYTAHPLRGLSQGYIFTPPPVHFFQQMKWKICYIYDNNLKIFFSNHCILNMNLHIIFLYFPPFFLYFECVTTNLIILNHFLSFFSTVMTTMQMTPNPVSSPYQAQARVLQGYSSPHILQK